MIAGETKLGILGLLLYHSFIIFLLNARTKCMHSGHATTIHDACRGLPGDGIW